MKNLKKQIEQIIDFLFPKLDAYEQMFYLYLFRNTILKGKREIMVPLSSIHKNVGLGIGRMGSSPSRQVVRNKFSSLEKKKCIKLLERTRQGIIYRVFLPEEIPDTVPSEVKEPKIKDIESLDFYKDPSNRLSLLMREKNKCFYCSKEITKKNYVIDHVIPKMSSGNDSYKNCVASCLDCNSNKQGISVDEFIKSLYRDGLLNRQEFSALKEKLEMLKSGKLKPDVY